MKRTTTRILTGFTPYPAALEWCLPVWRGFTVYWHFYRFVQVRVIAKIYRLPSKMFEIYVIESLNKAMGGTGREVRRGDALSVMAPCGYLGHLFLRGPQYLYVALDPRCVLPACWTWPIYLGSVTVQRNAACLHGALITPVERNCHSKCPKREEKKEKEVYVRVVFCMCMIKSKAWWLNACEESKYLEGYRPQSSYIPQAAG